MPIDQEDKEGYAEIDSNPIIKYIIIAICISIFIVVIWFVFFNKSNINNKIEQTENKISLTDKEKNELLDKISKHIITFDMQNDPIIISVDNSNELKKQQAFFKDINNGDILLISKEKALIYRPENDTLINVGPIFVNNLQK